jgi:hypothetical protein
MNRVGIVDYIENRKMRACILPYKSGGADAISVSLSSPN